MAHKQRTENPTIKTGDKTNNPTKFITAQDQLPRRQKRLIIKCWHIRKHEQGRTIHLIDDRAPTKSINHLFKTLNGKVTHDKQKHKYKIEVKE